MKDKDEFKELTREELISVQGGSKIKDAIKGAAEWVGEKVGEKVGEALDFLSRLDWTGSPLGY